MARDLRGVAKNYEQMVQCGENDELATLYFPADKSTFTMYGDELHLLTNKDGSPVPPDAIAYDRTYLFRWEGDQKYECVVQDIPGKPKPEKRKQQPEDLKKPEKKKKLMTPEEKQARKEKREKEAAKKKHKKTVNKSFTDEVLNVHKHKDVSLLNDTVSHLTDEEDTDEDIKEVRTVKMPSSVKDTVMEMTTTLHWDIKEIKTDIKKMFYELEKIKEGMRKLDEDICKLRRRSSTSFHTEKHVNKNVIPSTSDDLEAMSVKSPNVADTPSVEVVADEDHDSVTTPSQTGNDTDVTQLADGVVIKTAIFQNIWKSTHQPNPFCLKLTAALFPEDVLARSNIEGKNGKERLDGPTIDAIINQVFQRFKIAKEEQSNKRKELLQKISQKCRDARKIKSRLQEKVTEDATVSPEDKD